MNKHTLSWILLMLAAFYSHAVLAKCDTPREQQQIHIKKINDRIQIEHKAESEHCIVKNNLAHDANHGSRVVWVFNDLDCKAGECRIELNGNPTLKAGVLKCDLGGPTKTQCHLLVNRLKAHCDSLSTTTADKCQVDYLIKVRGENIDPSIIIQPSPTYPN